MELTTKICTMCKELLPRSAFHKAGIGIQGACKQCVVKRVDAWRLAHPDARAKEYASSKIRGKTKTQRMSKEARSAHYRAFDLKRKYGITPEVYDAMLNAQGGVCAICSAPPGKSAKGRLAVDHDHDSLKNRGLLCASCNGALQKVENDPEWGTKALNYLARYIEQTVKV